ncbi:hypothetical protein [Streptomyces sp. NPDC048623]|uniref:hypothetical protein n=1 Tax=Streptomyces sp. NPDC048623 TaxID=3155761 RepID=UPI00343C4447
MSPDDSSPPPASHPTWWKAPLVATLPGLPLLVGEFALFWTDGYTSGFETMLVMATILLAISWVLPHRMSMRIPRLLAAGTALAVTTLPLMLALLMGLAMASG